MTSVADELSRVSAEVRSCKKCPLWEGRINAVPGEGPPAVDLVLVGEAPGRTEDLHGRPFVGAAGRKLEGLLREAGVSREKVFITNAVKCRPPSNRRPGKKEVDTCYQYLRRQIDLLSPKMVVLMGDVALKRFFPDDRLPDVHGKVLMRKDRWFLPTYHPAAVIYNPSLEMTMREDFRSLGRELRARQDRV